MEIKTTRFLKVSLVLVSVFCVIIFTIQMACINMMGENTIRDLGVFYMSGISKQVTSHFGTIMELRLSQVESLVNSVPPGRATDETSMRIELSYNARAAGFEYLALYTEEDDLHMLYGSQLTPDSQETMRRSARGGKYNVFAGKDEEGTPVVLFGLPANYPMADGSKSVALVAGLPTRYLNDTLADNVKSNIVAYAIIRDDGSYILNNHSVKVENYFDWVKTAYETCNGQTPEQYADGLRAALKTDDDFTREVCISGEHWNIYCTSLPNSDWHLLLRISHNTMDETIRLLQRKWSYISIGGGCLIICALLCMFLGYYRLAKIHMRQLEEARKTAEQAMLTAERSNKAKNEFLSNMSHDIRTPMNGIMGMTTIAIDSLDNPSRVRSCLKKIYVSSRHLLGLITDILDMSKIENGKLSLNLEPLSLREIMQNIAIVIHPQIQEKNQQFRIYIHDIYHENVCSDRVRLSQILLNILGNAVKFTPKGGTIEADLFEEPSPKGSSYIRSHLKIKDNGIGMSKEFLDKIFDAFAREDHARVDKADGAGMGMTITKFIIDAMGGTISVDSEQGKGSCFHVILDMEITVGQEKELRLPERNVLLIDADETAGRLAVSALESIGLHAETAPDCEQAARMLEERQTGKMPYHLLLLDQALLTSQQIPCGNQETVMGDLTGRFHLPLILLTDGEPDDLEMTGVRACISSYIVKPLFRSGLYYSLRPFIETAAGQEPQQEAETDLSGKRILLAEDNELNWEIAHEMLSALGIDADWAENGRVCVEKFVQSPLMWYDAIIMDLRMPVMTGFEAMQAIRRLNREDAKTIPTIALSADAFADDIRKCLDCGMNAHLSKPLQLEELIALLKQYLR